MKVIILAGGGGSRLFPLSRKAYPKQFLALEDDKSLLVHTVERFLSLVPAEDIVLVTNESYLYHVQSELELCHAEKAHIVLEPVARNTAPAIALAAKYCESELECGRDEVMIIAAADHVIKQQGAFCACISKAAEVAAEDAFVTFGIKPRSPETGYGYIEAGTEENGNFKVRSFKEKPNLGLAEEYVAAGNYYWNSGMFAFTLGCIMDELATYQPEITGLMEGRNYGEVRDSFGKMPSISIDYAVAELSRKVRMVPLSCYWNDIGSWDAMYDILPKDEDGNAVKGDCITIGCKDSLLIGHDRLIAGIGIDDLLLIESDDVIVATKKGNSQKVKDVVETLKKNNRKEATEHTTLYYYWGTSSALGKGKNYVMRKLRIMPGKTLPMRMHYHRTEHFIVLSGTAEVKRDEKTMMIHENESAFIPQTTRYELSNPGRIPLEIIEIRNGTYLGEDDIVEF
ncbi:mannose-1-phosphate guanylyltransferase/mannose-6-phosphate isomerase [Selenomonas sp. KH1T6]|uniref:mannose-1-phosphate guanylyltransferase/mannose-6-phosphate isomerase n=1 Tax=Selenomonas sp. KH1T6 TaxID=3158784 RepID=UPI0008A80D31|nr:mannose-1-phosphate guanylyltransferase / mannose-6-phosphate isomerase [Selenomonas ruminantium]